MVAPARDDRGSAVVALAAGRVTVVALAVVALAAGGCRGPAGTEASGYAERVVLASSVSRPASVDAAFAPAFDALQAAVEDGEDDVARRILASIHARQPSDDLREFARCFERILDGRALVRELRLALAIDAVEGAPGDRRLVLVASHPRDEPVVLRLPAGVLHRKRVAIDPLGNESRSLTTERSPLLDELLIPAGAEVRIPVCSFELELGGALAVREQWSLDPRSGFVVVGGVELPAQDPSVDGCEAVRPASFLPAAAVAPEELVRYLGRGAEVFLPALLERAVRIAPERREEALDLLAPEVARLAAERPERLVEAAPALRWLARTFDAGRDPEAWAAWFAARTAARGRERDPGALVIPEDPRER